jgi:hypothetical protein
MIRNQLHQRHEFAGWPLVFIMLFGLIPAFISEDTGLFLLGNGVLALFVYLFFARTFPPVLLMSAFFQWFFYHGKLLDAMFKGKSVVDLNYFSKTKEDIIILGLIGTTSFFLGMYIFVRKTPILTFGEIKSFCLRIRIRRLFQIYVAVYVLLLVAGNVIWLLPGLRQPLYILTLFRWSLFFLLFMTVFFQQKFKAPLFAVILLDMGLSFFSFFSHFKEVIFFSFLAFWIFVFRVSLAGKIFTLFLVVGTFYLGMYWTVVKQEYRQYLNKGTGAPAVLISRSEAYDKLLQLVADVNGSDLNTGYDELIERLSWIGAFDAVYKHVPAKIHHEDGNLWLAGVTRPFMPRLLFPEKKDIADSKELNYYSGLGVDEKNTSISLSAMAGSYIDFGARGMHLILLLFGVFCGWIYTKAVVWSRHPVIGYAMTMPMIYLMQFNEQSINRMVSAMVLYFIGMWFVQRFFLDEFLAIVLNKDSERNKNVLQRQSTEG